jgi:hypothetical protein
MNEVLGIVLSVLQFTDSDYPFFELFLTMISILYTSMSIVGKITRVEYKKKIISVKKLI